MTAPRTQQLPKSLARWLPECSLALGLVAAGVVAAWQTRRLYFFGDEWAFLLERDLSIDLLLAPHNEHWVTLPRLAYWVMGGVFGIDHHLAYGLMPILLHLAICALVYVLLRRFGTSRWPAVLATLLLGFLCGNLGENPLWPFQIGFLGSAFLGLLAVLVHDLDRGRRGLALGWTASVLSLMCSGMALPMLGLLGVVSLTVRGIRSATLAVVPPAAVYLLWHLGYGREAAVQSSDPGVGEVLTFVGSGLGSLYEPVLRLPGAGAAVFLALVVVPLVAPTSLRTRQHAVSGVVACVMMYLLLGVSRAGLSNDFAYSSRYAYFGVLMTLPALALVLDLLAGRLWSQSVKVAAVVAAGVAIAASGSSQTVAFTDARLTLSPGLEQRVLGAKQLVDAGAPLLGHQVEPRFNGDITVKALQDPEISRLLPDRTPTRQGLLDASVGLQVAAGSDSFGLPDAQLVAPRSVKGDVPDTGCVELQAGAKAWLDIPPADGGQEVAITVRKPVLTVELHDGKLISASRDLTVTRGAQVLLATTAESQLRVFIPPGPFTLCRG